MKSHSVEFTPRELIKLVAPPLVPVALFALAMEGGARFGLFPAPRPALDVDRTILVHQAESSRVRSGAEVVLLGDSSCLMNVNARQLGDALGRRALNLGTISFLDLGAHARLLREFTQANPGQPRIVVLLMHPEALRRGSSEPYPLEVLNHYLARTDQHRVGTFAGRMNAITGVDVFQSRLLSRAVPTPFTNSFGRFYGFTRDLERFMSAHDGSAIDPSAHPAKGNAEYRLSATLEKLSRDFRASAPPGTKLLVGITPVPAKFAGTNYPALRDQMLRDWSAWLQPDAALSELPASLPDEQITGATHLKPAAIPAYTEALAAAVRAHVL
jgi:hypothetical protein